MSGYSVHHVPLLLKEEMLIHFYVNNFLSPVTFIDWRINVIVSGMWSLHSTIDVVFVQKNHFFFVYFVQKMSSLWFVRVHDPWIGDVTQCVFILCPKYIDIHWLYPWPMEVNTLLCSVNFCEEWITYFEIMWSMNISLNFE